MTLSPLLQQLERRSGQDRRQPAPQPCLLAMAWTRDAVPMTAIATIQRAILGMKNQHDGGIALTTIELPPSGPTQQDLDTLGRANGLLWAVGDDAAAHGLLTRAARKADIPVLRVVEKPEDMEPFIRMAYDAIQISALAAPGSVDREQRAAVSHFLLQARRRRDMGPIHNLRQLAAAHEAELERWSSIRKQPPQYRTTPKALLEWRPGEGEQTTRGVSVSRERYVVTAARAAWELFEQGRCTAAELQKPPNADDDPTQLRRILSRIAHDAVPGDTSVALAFVTTPATREDHADPMHISSTQSYACIRLWRAHHLLARRTGGTLVAGSQSDPDGTGDHFTRARGFFSAALRLYEQLLDAPDS